MAERTYVITDPLGIHARPAGILTKAAKEIGGNLTIAKDGKRADARKMFAVMGLGIKHGDAIIISADDQAALDAFCQVVQESL